jgi:hypothetical protein
MRLPMDSLTNPSQCAGGPFARVATSWISDNQTLPARLHKREIDTPVRALTLDFDFSQIPERYGNRFILAYTNYLQIAMAKCTSLRPPRPLKHNEMQ